MTLDCEASLRVRSHLGFQLKLTLQPEGDRPVIDQSYPHMRTETAGFDASVARAGGQHQNIEQFPPLIGWSCGRKAGSQPLVCLRGQGELRYQQQISLDLAQIQIHFSVLVREYPVLEQAIEQPQGGRFVVGGAYPDQYQESRADGRDTLGVDVDAGAQNALQQSDHDVLAPLRRR